MPRPINLVFHVQHIVGGAIPDYERTKFSSVGNIIDAAPKDETMVPSSQHLCLAKQFSPRIPEAEVYFPSFLIEPVRTAFIASKLTTWTASLNFTSNLTSNLAHFACGDLSLTKSTDVSICIRRFMCSRRQGCLTSFGRVSGSDGGPLAAHKTTKYPPPTASRPGPTRP